MLSSFKALCVRENRCAQLLILTILLLSFGLKLNNLGHHRFGSIDECCHALVAKNLLNHPLKPTLIDEPYVSYTETDWSTNHIWLHKPILPLWQGALSYCFFGVNTFAFRFPSAILSTLAVWLTYLIGVELLTRRAALIAALVQAFSWFIMQLVQGYQFSDAIDISLLFYCELGMYGVIRAVKTGKWRFVLLAGLGQGLAFLSKTYPAFIVTGVALAGWLAPRFRLAKQENVHLRWQHLLGILGITVVIGAPWMLYTAIQYPIEFKIEHDYIFRHLTEDIENWGAPWYMGFLDSDRMFDCLFIPVAVAVCGGLTRLFREKHLGRMILYAWGIGVIIPFLIATTKTPSAMLLKMPAFFLIFGDFAARTTRRCTNETRGHRRLQKAWIAILCLLSFISASGAWQSTTQKDDKKLMETAAFVKTHLSQNAVLLTEIDQKKVETHFAAHTLMFLTSRTAHLYHSEDAWNPLSRQVRKNGGIPYIVTFRKLDLPVVFKSEADGRTIYLVSDTSHEKNVGAK